MSIILTLANTGINPYTSSIVEIQALVINDYNQIVDSFSLHTKPHPNPKVVIDFEFLDKVGIEEKQLIAHKDFKDGFASFKDFLDKYKEKKPFLIVWNKMYIEFLVNYCKQNNLLLSNYVNITSIELLSIFTFMLKGNELECYTLESICDYFGVTFKIELIHKVKILYSLYTKL